MRKSLWAAAAATAFVSSAAWAIVTFDVESGTGFVGKGDVQLVYAPMNDAKLQAVANSVDFRVQVQTVTEVSWECTNSNNEKTQERSRTTTTSLNGLVTTVARDNKNGKITGFNLTGYDGGNVTESTETDGPSVNSCPAAPSSWYLSTPAGDPELISSTGGGLEVTKDGTNWYPIG